VAAGRSKSLTTGNVRCGVAAVHEVLGSLALETLVNCHSELMEDSLRVAMSAWSGEAKNVLLTMTKEYVASPYRPEASAGRQVPRTNSEKREARLCQSRVIH